MKTHAEILRTSALLVRNSEARIIQVWSAHLAIESQLREASMRVAASWAALAGSRVAASVPFAWFQPAEIAGHFTAVIAQHRGFAIEAGSEIRLKPDLEPLPGLAHC